MKYAVHQPISFTTQYGFYTVLLKLLNNWEFIKVLNFANLSFTYLRRFYKNNDFKRRFIIVSNCSKH